MTRGRPDFTSEVSKTSFGEYSGEQSFVVLSFDETAAGGAVTTYTPTATVNSGEAWLPVHARASIDASTLIRVDLTDDTPAFMFASRYGYGTVNFNLHYADRIAAGSTIKFTVVNYDGNDHDCRFGFDALIITV